MKKFAYEYVESSDDLGDMGEYEKCAAEALIASEVDYIKTALEECVAADREIEAARKRKKKWIKGIGLKKGRLSKYKKPGESMEEAARRALRSDDPSVRGTGSFFLATRKFRKRKGKESADEVEAKELSYKEREKLPSGAFVFPAGHPKVKDDKPHFPINDEAHGKNALARANQYGAAPSWYNGSLEDLKKTVADKVKAKFPGIEVTEESYK